MSDIYLACSSSCCFIGSCKRGQRWQWTMWSSVAYEMEWEFLKEHADKGLYALEGDKLGFRVCEPSGIEHCGKAFLGQAALDRHIATNSWDHDFIRVTAPEEPQLPRLEVEPLPLAA